MYDIGIPEIKCTAKYIDKTNQIIKYDAEAADRPGLCINPECEKPKRMQIHSRKNSLIKDVRAEGKLVVINLAVKRYRCPTCGSIVLDKFTFYKKNSRMTNRLRDEFVRRCINGETFSYIARDYGVDHKTVAAVFKDYANDNKDILENDYTPEILGIDEAHIDDHYRLVLTDIKAQKLLDIKKDNSSPTVKQYLKTLDPAICKCAAMDFAPGYAGCVAAILPDASIVIDKFHVIQEINRCLDKVRIFIQNNLKKRGIDIRKLKKSKKLFMMNFEDAVEKENASLKLSEWFTEFPELYEAYMAKETFRDIYRYCDTKKEAGETFDRWIETIPDYKEFDAMKKTFTKRKRHILNYWDFKWTNAYTESVNNLIKKTEKVGRGYKFEVLRDLCLLQVNIPKAGLPNPKTAEYEMSETCGTSMIGETAVPYKISKKSKYTIGIDYRFYTKPEYEKDLFHIYIENAVATNESFKRRLSAYVRAIREQNYIEN